jgi:hypothetical protein
MPESCADQRCFTVILPVCLFTSTNATVAAYESLCVPIAMPQPVTTLPLWSCEAGTCGVYPEASTAALSTPA